VWPAIVKFANDHGVKIAIENCPMIFSNDEWPGGNNLAISPYVWRKMWEIIPDPNFGLNLDPSHLIWQMIDMVRVVYEFGPRIFHVHAKDLRIDREQLYQRGVMSLGMGWQIPRLPGLGDVNWAVHQRFVRRGLRLRDQHRARDRAFEKTELISALPDLARFPYIIARSARLPPPPKYHEQSHRRRSGGTNLRAR
jgi:hypothetical protein